MFSTIKVKHTHVIMGVNSRRKGNRAERSVAKLFEKWTGRKFAKTPASGGLQWKSSFAKGDILCTKEGHYCPFCIEVKFHKDINFSELMLPNRKEVKVLEFWEQASRDAKSCDKVPLLFMRYNRMPADFYFVAIPTNFLQTLGSDLSQLRYRMDVHFEDLSITIVRSDEFFKLSYKEVRKLAKTHIKKTKRHEQ